MCECGGSRTATVETYPQICQDFSPIAEGREGSLVKHEDAELVARARTGDERAYRALLERYERPVFTICLRMVRDRELAADLAQDAFIKVFSMLDRYDRRYAFSSWLFKITSNLCIDHLRRRRVETVPMDDPIAGEDGDIRRQYAADGPDPHQQAERSERMAMLEEAIAELPEHYRVILLLRHQEHLAYEEIARVLDVPLGTVKARIHRAREALRRILEERDFF